jgi:uncharacterized protein DUF5667/putative zinc finger protein
VLTHATTRDWLIPYADGMLAADERRRIDGHITGCPACAAELREVRELNLLLVTLPPAPPASYPPFWLKVQARLPQRRSWRVPGLAGYRRVGLAFAVAAIAALGVAGSAFAAPAALPDNPLYPVKQLEEHVRLALTPTPERLDVQMQLAKERLREAQVMAATHKPEHAARSLRAFAVILGDAAVALKNPVDPRIAREDLRQLRIGLDAVERANATRGDDDGDVKQLVVASVDNLDRIESEELETEIPPSLVVGEQATPEPKPQPAPKPTPRPKPSDDREHDREHDRD